MDLSGHKGLRPAHPLSIEGASPGAHADLRVHTRGILQGPYRLGAHGIPSLGKREPTLGEAGET